MAFLKQILFLDFTDQNDAKLQTSQLYELLVAQGFNRIGKLRSDRLIAHCQQCDQQRQQSTHHKSMDL